MTTLKQPPNCPQISKDLAGRWWFCLDVGTRIIVGSVGMRAWLRERERIFRERKDDVYASLAPYDEAVEQASLWSKYAGGE